MRRQGDALGRKGMEALRRLAVRAEPHRRRPASRRALCESREGGGTTRSRCGQLKQPPGDQVRAWGGGMEDKVRVSLWR